MTTELTDTQRIAKLATAVSILREALRASAQGHHVTLTNSRLHDPETWESFENCPCKSCIAATAALAEVSASFTEVDGV